MSEVIKIWDVSDAIGSNVRLHTVHCDADNALSLASLEDYYGHVTGLMDSEGRLAFENDGYLFPPNDRVWGKKVYFLERYCEASGIFRTLPFAVQNNLEDLVETFPSYGIPINELCDEYYEDYFRELDYEFFGYNNIEELVEDCPYMILKGGMVKRNTSYKRYVSRKQADSYLPITVIENIENLFHHTNLSKIYLTELCSLYRETYGRRLDYRYLGYNSVKNLVKDCLDFVVLCKRQEDGEDRFIRLKRSDCCCTWETFCDTRTGFCRERRKAKCPSVPLSILGNLEKLITNNPKGIFLPDLGWKYEEMFEKNLDCNSLGYLYMLDLIVECQAFECHWTNGIESDNGSDIYIKVSDTCCCGKKNISQTSKRATTTDKKSQSSHHTTRLTSNNSQPSALSSSQCQSSSAIKNANPQPNLAALNNSILKFDQRSSTSQPLIPSSSASNSRLATCMKDPSAVVKSSRFTTTAQLNCAYCSNTNCHESTCAKNTASSFSLLDNAAVASLDPIQRIVDSDQFLATHITATHSIDTNGMTEISALDPINDNNANDNEMIPYREDVNASSEAEASNRNLSVTTSMNVDNAVIVSSSGETMSMGAAEISMSAAECTTRLDAESDVSCTHLTTVVTTVKNDTDANDHNETNICSICLERRWDAVFLCGHFACHVCASSLQECHMCRDTIEKVIRLYV